MNNLSMWISSSLDSAREGQMRKFDCVERRGKRHTHDAQRRLEGAVIAGKSSARATRRCDHSLPVNFCKPLNSSSPDAFLCHVKCGQWAQRALSTSRSAAWRDVQGTRGYRFEVVVDKLVMASHRVMKIFTHPGPWMLPLLVSIYLTLSNH